MIEREDVVAAVIAAAGGELTGRVRLHKAVYLLDQLGLDSGFWFNYHHYGPFSRDLDNAVADAKAFGLVAERVEQRQTDGAPYSVFRHTSPTKAIAYGKLGRQRTGDLMHLFAQTNITVLELAATIDWLWRVEARGSDWRTELRRRKGIKVQNGRLEDAVTLLERINLTPPAQAA